jgi:uncharacterized protein with ParB-like and HNH nuclease domain
MATTLFKDTTYSVFGLIEDIRQGEVALPDIQRPFVWGASKVRDLLDSMYKGFPSATCCSGRPELRLEPGRSVSKRSRRYLAC